MSAYGHFSEDGREYIITQPDTPRPWINYLSNERFCALCSHTGGGYSFYESSGYNHITKKYPPIVELRDRPGRFIYVRDNESGEYWGLNWQPVMKDYTHFVARHAPGWTSVNCTRDEIEGHVTYFVPRQDDAEIWMVRIKNTGKKVRKISLFPFVEWSLANYSFNLTEAAFSQLFNEVAVENETIFVTTRFWNVSTGGGANPNLRWDKYAFFTSSLPVAGYDALTEEFIGIYRDWQNPLAVERGYCSNSIGNGRDIIGAFQHDLELSPGEEVQFCVTVGVAYNTDTARQIRDKYRDWSDAEHSLREVNRYWDDHLTRNTCHTPDKSFDISFNTWNKYQAWITSRWSRMDSYFIGGGSIIGFRDSWQDMLAILPNNTEWARQRTIYLLEHQFPDGSTLHNWDPLTNIGVKTGHSDDPLWLVLGVIENLKETGDTGFLDVSVGYYDGGSETIREHVVHALDYSLSRMSPRGIPLMEAADWNDGLDQIGRQGRGESSMVAGHLVWMLREATEIFRRTGRDDLADRYSEAREAIIEATNKFLWDGEWYVRGTRDDGQFFGSSKNDEAKIYLNAQTWQVLGGLAPPDRAVQCMDSVETFLDTEFGPAMFLPAYNEPNPKIGIITRFCPGTKENGTIFNHPVCWAIMAECILGRGDRAYDLWQRSSFMTRGEQPEVYKVEPFVYAEYVHGPDSVSFGQGEFTWMTGTAAWMWKVCLEWILGVRPEMDGLRIEPCIPSTWDRASVKRSFRNATYNITIENPDHLNRGVIEVTVDGSSHSSNLIPPFKDGKTHEARVILGKID
jgi:cellobiose phosphorylase